MKKYLVIVAVMLGMNAFGQTDEQLTEVSDATCKCLNEKGIEAGDMSRLQIELGVCMLAAMSANNIPFDVSDLQQMEEMGEKVGMKLAFSCPKFLEIIGEMAEEDPEGMMEIVESRNSFSKTDFTSGQVVSVNTGDFVTVKVQTDSGRKETFYWMEYFGGSELLENDGKLILDQEVFIEYESIEVYSPKLGDYTNLKVLRSLAK